MKDVNGKELDKVWMAEFRGFFFGEGYLGITTNGKERRKNRWRRKHHLARAAITLRDDDEEILKAIREKLGGIFHREGHGRKSNFGDKEFDTKPYVVWRVTSKEDVSRVCDILEGGLLPSKKRREIIIMRKFLATVGTQKRGPKTPKKEAEFGLVLEERERLAAEIRRLHSYDLGRHLHGQS